jgi:hypothetical protein
MSRLVNDVVPTKQSVYKVGSIALLCAGLARLLVDALSVSRSYVTCAKECKKGWCDTSD